MLLGVVSSMVVAFHRDDGTSLRRAGVFAFGTVPTRGSDLGTEEVRLAAPPAGVTPRPVMSSRLACRPVS
jgi:hypothetical protein